MENLKNNNKRISVIIPTYKPGQYIYECLDSLTNQTLERESYEVIIVLNGCDSPWNTQIVDYINKEMQNVDVRFFHTLIPGVSNARNIAIDNAMGEYIMFLDDDDYISPSTLEDLLTVVSPISIAVFKPLAFYNMNENFEYSRSFEYNQKSKLGKTTINQSRKVFSGPVMKLIHRDIIGKRRYDTRFRVGEDSLFMFLISDRIDSVCYAPDTAIYYRRIRENSATTGNRSYFTVAKNSFALIREYSSIYFSNPLRYDFIFYTTRILGAIKAILYTRGNTF